MIRPMTAADVDRAERVIKHTIEVHGALDALGYGLQLVTALRNARAELDTMQREAARELDTMQHEAGRLVAEQLTKRIDAEQARDRAGAEREALRAQLVEAERVARSHREERDELIEHLRGHTEDGCACQDCDCACHNDGETVDHVEAMCTCLACNCACHS